MNLKFTLAAQNDEALREEIRKIITTETRKVITEELGSIIRAEVTKLRLTDPESPTVQGMIQHQIGLRVDKAVAEYVQPADVKRQLNAAVLEAVAPAVRDVRQQVAKALTEKLSQ